MELRILGCFSSTPKLNALPTAQLLEIRNHLFLIDCGEGTQMQLRKYKIKFTRIKHIFISHLHGDHYYGLPGLINTFSLLGREADLHVYGPKGIKEIITLQMKLAKSWTTYNLFFHELNQSTSQLVYQNDDLSVQTIPLDHRVYTNGYLFKESKSERKLNPKKAKEHQIDVAYFNKLKQGADVKNEHGQLIKNQWVTTNGPPAKSYAFCSDTAFKEDIIPIIKNVDTLYHESTFLEKHKHLTQKTKHSTAAEAAQIAANAQVRNLILGHFSTRYDDLNAFTKEALQYFKHVELAEDGKLFKI